MIIYIFYYALNEHMREGRRRPMVTTWQLPVQLYMTDEMSTAERDTYSGGCLLKGIIGKELGAI